MQNNNRVWIKIKELKNMIRNLWSIKLGIKKIIRIWWLRLTWKHRKDLRKEIRGVKKDAYSLREKEVKGSENCWSVEFEGERERVKVTFRLLGGMHECDFLPYCLSLSFLLSRVQSNEIVTTIFLLFPQKLFLFFIFC